MHYSIKYTINEIITGKQIYEGILVLDCTIAEMDCLQKGLNLLGLELNIKEWIHE